MTTLPEVRTRIAWPWAVVAVIAAAAVVIPLLSGDQVADFSAALQPPSAKHLLGTDHSGYDLLVRCAEALRISLVIAAVCALAATVLGLLIGIASALAGGWVDALVMRLVDGFNALPHLVVGIVIAAMWRGAPLAIIASIALTHWPAVARVVRAELLAVADAGWVQTSRLAGASRWFVARRHLVPAVTGQALVAMIMLLPHAIWHESTLSFLGVGLSPDRASLGTLLGEARGDVFTGAWWTLAVPAAALIVTALAFALGGSSARRRGTPPTGQVW
ncbi:binding-protein-dependent transport system inner membrane protein [Mycolicibacterium phlei]|jgi:peptide/nickel transport system permease protein|uniref:ABC transporter permease n=1 Tax=Mycolicibacterium phlei DSM 43239 = CCUG 21000 TaxID=1226750 RepID=A0A5N5VGQ8_MYCPH|nr:ABC transporter permease [Mycolicibacterium phlei]VEG11435.1 binding-protein-dependent transport system inner membrane protein [Mycobacteroides chelonae]AMO63339.1 Dipeptide transport system permease protein DppC [Mycolicibacterium phlei]EID16040.1 dipeptide/oligopeptide/nickel ABC transporter permease [Mycolicibacterium phlei RIVM601174]KAB7759800.1 ABC transporter permease [Mycolicibacterium phlei DSM 43239 = CCUG 21000]KXW64165.1 ABC transporter permease [Mycolicibacterium phlei DSM 4307